MTENGLRRIVILLVIETVYTSEIRYPALCTDTRASEENNVIALCYHLFQLKYPLIHVCSLLISVSTAYAGTTITLPTSSIISYMSLIRKLQ